MTSPPASGTCSRTSLSRRSADRSTAGIHSPFGIERGAPRLRGDVLGVVLAELRLHLVAGLGAPAHLAGVDEEDHRPDDAVLERAAVAVAVVRAREPDAVLVGVVLHERDRRGVAAERGPRQQQAPRGAVVRLAQRVAPAERVAAVVHLVEDDERPRVLDEALVDGCLHRHLRVGDGHPVIVPGRRVVAVGEGRIEPDRRRGPRHPPTGS